LHAFPLSGNSKEKDVVSLHDAVHMLVKNPLAEPDLPDLEEAEPEPEPEPELEPEVPKAVGAFAAKQVAHKMKAHEKLGDAMLESFSPTILWWLTALTG